MTENNEVPAVETPAPAQAAKVKRTRSARKVSSKVRAIDPGIAAIHAEAKAKVAEYRKASASGRILKTIIEKRLAQLVEKDQQALFDELSKRITPALL